MDLPTKATSLKVTANLHPTPPAICISTAVMVENATRTVHFAMQLGQVEEIDTESVAKLHRRYKMSMANRTNCP